jgi:hypothetical protein
VLKKPTYSSAIETRHTDRVRATTEQLNQRMTSLIAEQKEILKEIKTLSNNQDLMRESQEINDQILNCEIDINDENEM